MRADLEVLEFPALLDLLGRYARTPGGCKRLLALRPHHDREQLEVQLDRSREAAEYLRAAAAPAPAESSKGGSGPGKSAPLLRLDFGGIGDLEPVLANLRMEGAELEPSEISAVLQLLDRAGDCKHVLTARRDRFPVLAELVAGIGEFCRLLRELSGKIRPDGTLEDHASLELWRLRREIEKQKRAVQESLNSFLRRHAEEDILQEELVTIRNERFVVPVKVGARRRLDGVVHGSSSSGQTLFVEPMQTIELNNELVALVEEELQEVHCILREMTARLREQAGGVQLALEILTELDVAFAKGRFAVEFDCVTPHFNTEPRLCLREARHPLLQEVLREVHRRRSRTQARPGTPTGASGRPSSAPSSLPAGPRSSPPAGIVPLSLELDREHRVLVISGPNAGGKTVALKTLGLLVLAAQAGIPVPAAEADLPLLEQVLADIGDYQSIQESLSTFSAHLTNIQRIVEQTPPGTPSERTLVLLDELGAATDPQEGGALAVAIADYFLRSGALVLASTHHLALKAYATNTPGVLNASVGFDERTLQPTYRLNIGIPGKSSGIAIAQRLGLQREIVARARQALSTQDEEVSRLLAKLHQSTEEAERLRTEVAAREQQLRERTAQVAAQWEKREKRRLDDMEQRVESLLGEFDQQARAVLQQIDDRRLQKQAERRVARARSQLREEFDTAVVQQLGGTAEEAQAKTEKAPRPLLALREGDRVRVRALGRQGVVRRRLDWNHLEVEVGAMKMKVSLDQVEAVTEPQTSQAPENVTVHLEARTDVSPSEINVIGSTAEEARERVDKFLDSAVLAAMPKVRVVHGHGMGVLRRTLHEFFGGHPQVERFYPARQQEGGPGATIVELRV